MLACTALITLLWVIYGYTFALDGSGTFIGGAEKLFLAGVTPDSLNGTMPETVWITFQLTFAIITPALIAEPAGSE